MSNLGAAQETIIRLLADGQFHSGEALGQVLGVSRAAVWKQLRSLAVFGLELESMRGRGYRLVGGLDLINVDELKARLSAVCSASISDLQVLASTDSTNKRLMDAIAAGDQPHGHVIFAEYQSDGKGRRGRQWVSPFGASISGSFAWRSSTGIAGLEGLSLAVGVAVVEALHALGVSDIGLKWPNDIIVAERGSASFAKLGGILVEIKGDVAGECWVVVGVGLNMRMPATIRDSIDQPVADIDSVMRAGGGDVPSRQDVSESIINNVALLMSTYQRDGFAAYAQRWQCLHAYHHREVILSSPGYDVAGRVKGVNAAGALIVENNTGEHVLSGGEISLSAVN